MFIPQQEHYFVVAWKNGVTSVHLSDADAELHIKRLRGQDPSSYYIARSSASLWQETPAKIIKVSSIDEREL